MSTSIDNVGMRLSQLMESFSTYYTINILANKQTDPKLNKIVESQGGFWRTVNTSLQESVLIGIISLLDKDSGSDSFYEIFKQIKLQNHNSTFTTKLNDIEKDLDLIQKKYNRFRNKLIGHNDKNRLKIAKKFDERKFTFDEFKEDINLMDIHFKFLWHIFYQSRIVEKDKLAAMNFPQNTNSQIAKKATEKLLNELRKLNSI